MLSVPLLLEYESVAKRPGMLPHLDLLDIDDILNVVCSRSVEQRIYYQWRPLLPDPEDDMLVELAIAAGARTIVTSNVGDFEPARDEFGIEIATPRDFIRFLKSR